MHCGVFGLVLSCRIILPRQLASTSTSRPSDGGVGILASSPGLMQSCLRSVITKGFQVEPNKTYLLRYLGTIPSDQAVKVVLYVIKSLGNSKLNKRIFR